MPYARLLALAAGCLLLAAGWAHAWIATVSQSDITYGDSGNGVRDMIVLGDGDVLASGDGPDIDGIVARFDLATGAYRLLPYGLFCRDPRGLVQLPDGDVVVNGTADGCVGDGYWTVTRFDPNGWKRWTFTVKGLGGVMAYGGDDILVVGGDTYGFETPEENFSLARLDPTTGAPVWTIGFDRPMPRRLVVDSAGDVYTDVAGERLGVVKRSATDGSEMWSYDPLAESLRGNVAAILVDANDDVVASGQLWEDESTDPTLTQSRVVKLSGDTGDVLWTYDYGPGAYTSGRPQTALAANGDVVVAGSVRTEDGHYHFRVERLGGTDGVPVWVNEETSGNVSDVALTPDGDVVVTGTYRGIVTVRLAGSDGSRLWDSQIEPFCAHGDGGSSSGYVGTAPDGTVLVGGALCTDDDYDEGVMTVLALRGDDGTLRGVPTTTTTSVSTTTTTSTTLPDGLCATLERSGCLDVATPRRLRRRLARLCAVEPGTTGERRLMRRIERRLARIERAERLPTACLEALSRHLPASR